MQQPWLLLLITESKSLQDGNQGLILILKDKRLSLLNFMKIRLVNALLCLPSALPLLVDIAQLRLLVWATKKIKSWDHDEIE